MVGLVVSSVQARHRRQLALSQEMARGSERRADAGIADVAHEPPQRPEVGFAGTDGSAAAVGAKLAQRADGDRWRVGGCAPGSQEASAVRRRPRQPCGGSRRPCDGDRPRAVVGAGRGVLGDRGRQAGASVEDREDCVSDETVASEARVVGAAAGDRGCWIPRARAALARTSGRCRMASSCAEGENLNGAARMIVSAR